MKRSEGKRRNEVVGRLRIKVILIQESFQGGLMVDCSHSRDRKTGKQLGDVQYSIDIDTDVGI